MEGINCLAVYYRRKNREFGYNKFMRNSKKPKI